MTTFLSEQRWARTIFVALLFGLVLWPKASFAQNVASQDQAGSVLTVENLSAQRGRHGLGSHS